MTNRLLARWIRQISLRTGVALALLSGSALVSAQNIWLSNADILSLQKQPVKTAGLIRQCDNEMSTEASPVSVFAPPPHYTTDGVVVTDASIHLSGDGGLAYRAALCFTLTSNKQYASHAQRVISAWANQLKSVRSVQGAREINFSLPQYVLAASMVRNVNAWNDQSFRRLLMQIALPLSQMKSKNNIGNWGVLLNASIGAYLGDATILTNARTRWLELINSQVAADGSLPLEICRSDTSNICGGDHKGINGLSYTHYTLMPATAAAQIFDIQGQGVWKTLAGGKLEAAYLKAAGWTLHPETFPYFNANGGVLNGVRNAAYFALLQRHYPNEQGRQVIADGKLSLDGLKFLMLFN